MNSNTMFTIQPNISETKNLFLSMAWKEAGNNNFTAFNKASSGVGQYTLIGKMIRACGDIDVLVLSLTV